MADVIPLPKRGPSPLEVADAVEMLHEVSERARAMGLGLVAYPVEDVETVLSALKLRMDRAALEAKAHD